MQKIIFIDIDGTLRNSKKEVTDRTKNAIKLAKNVGAKIIICSGRARKYVENIARECDTSPIIIASDGADVYDYLNKESLYMNPINTKTCMELLNLSIKHNITMCIDTELGQFTNQEEKFSSSVQYDCNIENTIKTSNIIHLHFFDKDINKMKNLLEDVRKIKNIKIGNDGLYYNNVNYYIFTSSISSNKGDGIKNLCAKLNYDIKDTIAIGDDFNDKNMFEVTGYNVAMGNAIENLKKIADEITLTNDEDGVAVFLEKLCTFGDGS